MDSLTAVPPRYLFHRAREGFFRLMGVGHFQSSFDERADLGHDAAANQTGCADARQFLGALDFHIDGPGSQLGAGGGY